MRRSRTPAILALAAFLALPACNNGDDPGAVDTAVGTDGPIDGTLNGGIESPSGTGEGMPAVGTSTVTRPAGSTLGSADSVTVVPSTPR